MDQNDLGKKTSSPPSSPASGGLADLPPLDPLDTAEDETFSPPPPPPPTSKTDSAPEDSIASPKPLSPVKDGLGHDKPEKPVAPNPVIPKVEEKLGSLPPLPGESGSAEVIPEVTDVTSSKTAEAGKVDRGGKPKKKVGTKAIVGGLIALFLLVGVPLAALNVDMFRGDIRQRADSDVGEARYTPPPPEPLPEPWVPSEGGGEGGDDTGAGGGETPTPTPKLCDYGETSPGSGVCAPNPPITTTCVCDLGEDPGGSGPGTCTKPNGDTYSQDPRPGCSSGGTGGGGGESGSSDCGPDVCGNLHELQVGCESDGTKDIQLCPGWVCREETCEGVKYYCVGSGDNLSWSTDGSSCTSVGVCVETRIYTLQAGSWVLTALNEVGQHAGAGDKIRLAVRGDSSQFAMGRFRVNNGSWVTSTTKNAAGEYYVKYTLSQGGSYVIEGQVQ